MDNSRKSSIILLSWIPLEIVVYFLPILYHHTLSTYNPIPLYGAKTSSTFLLDRATHGASTKWLKCVRFYVFWFGLCVCVCVCVCAVADLRGGGLGFKPPPPPLGLPIKIKNLMCIEKRHHNMSRPTQYVPIALCLRLSLRQ